MKCLVAKFQEKEGNDLTEGGLIRRNGNPSGDGVERGTMMLVSPVNEISGRFINKRNKVGFITGDITLLQELIAEYNLKEGDDFSVAVGPHRIVTTEKLQTEVKKDDKSFQLKAVPASNEQYGGTVLTENGVPIMWKTEVVPEGSTLQDTKIKHDDLIPSIDDDDVPEFSEGKKALADAEKKAEKAK